MTIAYFRLCLLSGDASGPEEEDDEQQTEEIEVELKLSSDNELSVCGKEPYQSTKKSVQSSAENQKTYQEIQEVNTEMPSHEESSTSTRPSSSSSSTHHPSSSAWKQVNHSMTNGNTNHHQQYDKTQGRSVSPTSSDQHQSTSPHNQNQHQPQHQLGKGQGYYSYHYPPNGLNSYNGHTTYQSANQQQQQQQRTQFRRGGPHRYGSNNHPHSNGGSNGYGRANSWTNTSYNGSGSNNGCEPPKSHGIEKKIFNDGKFQPVPIYCVPQRRINSLSFRAAVTDIDKNHYIWNLKYRFTLRGSELMYLLDISTPSPELWCQLKVASRSSHIFYSLTIESFSFAQHSN